MKKTQKFLFSTLLAGALLVGAVNVNTQANVSVTAEELPAAIELAEGGVTARMNLKSGNLGNGYRFSAVKVVASDPNNFDTWKANGNATVWPAVYYGVADEGTIDLTQYTDFNLVVRSEVGAQIFLRWEAIDVNGKIANFIPYGSAASNGYDPAVKTAYGDIKAQKDDNSFYTAKLNSNGWQGFTFTRFNGNSWPSNGTGTMVLHSNYANDFSVQKEAGFDPTQVKTIGLVRPAYSAQTWYFGTMTGVKADGSVDKIIDADNLTRETFANAFSGDTKSIATFDLDKNEYYLANRSNYNQDCGTSYKIYDNKSVSYISVTSEYQKADNNVFEYTKTASNTSFVWTTWEVDNGEPWFVNTAAINAVNHDALVFDVDATAATKAITFDMEIRVDAGNTAELQYRNNGGARSTAYLVWETGEVMASVGHIIPEGFKGKFVLPFNQFYQMVNTSTTEVTLDDSSLNITGIKYICAPQYSNDGDKVSISNAKFVAYSAQELNVINTVSTFYKSFAMDEGVDLRLSEPAGLRFSVGVNNAAYEAVVAALEGVTYEFGTVIVPDEAEFNGYVPNGEGILTVKKVNSGVNEDGTYRWYASIVNINAANYERAFIARAYLQYTIGGKT